MADDRHYRALLIANWQYPRDPDQLPTLSGPQYDLPVMQAALTHPQTGLHRPDEVTVLTNRTRAEILSTLDDFFADGRRSDQLLIYFSGHGRLNLEDELYLCVQDTLTDRLVSSAVSAADISQMIAACRARAKIVVLDCCYSGSFKSGAVLPRRLAGEGRFVLTSSRRAQLSSDADAASEPSPFTHHLAQALTGAAPDSDRDGLISIDDVYHYVRDRLREVAGSTPQRSFDQAVGELTMALALASQESAGVDVDQGHGPWPAFSSAVARAATAVVAEGSPGGTRNLLSALAMERRNDLYEATRAYRTLSNAGAGDCSTMAAHRLGVLLERQGDLGAATIAYQVVVDDGHPEWAPRAACDLGDLRNRLRDTKAALAAYEFAADAGHPEYSPRGAFACAELMRSAGDEPATQSWLRRVAEWGYPGWSARAEVALGESHIRGGELGPARAALRRATLSDDPTAAERARVPLRGLVDAGAVSLDGLLASLARAAESGAGMGYGFDGFHEEGWRAAEALGDLGAADRAVPVLVRALAEGPRSVRMSAARALGQRGSAEAVGVLVQSLESDDAEVWWCAVAALAAIGAPAVPALTEALAHEDRVGHAALAALSAMGREVVPALATSLRSPRRSLRVAAAQALGRQGDAAVPALLDALRSDDREAREAAALGLTVVGAPATDGLIECLGASEAGVRAAAATVLGGMRMPRALGGLEHMLGDDDVICREAAADSLAGLYPEAVPAVARAMHSDASLRRSASVRAAVGMGGAVVPELIGLTEAPPPAADAAVDALREIGTTAALFHLSEIGRLDRSDQASQT